MNLTNEYTGWDNYVKEQQRPSEPSYGWNMPYAGPNYEPNRVDQLQKRVKDLEDWRGGFIPTALHDFKSITDRVKDLEEWQRTYNYNYSSQNYKLIDKKVWEDIKHHVAGINTGLSVITAERTQTHRHGLIDAIKKADPEWCDND